MIVIKLGGSLFDLPNLAVALRAFLSADALLVPGGGPMADAVRHWDTVHNLGDTASHLLALRSLTVTAELLRHLIPGSHIVSHPRGGTGVRILDSFEFLKDDTDLPHSWAVTSDSIAARAAIVAKATKLVLLKSVDVPPGTPWDVAAANGWVDDYFPTIASRLMCPVEVVNFRSWAAKFLEEA